MFKLFNTLNMWRFKINNTIIFKIDKYKKRKK